MDAAKKRPKRVAARKSFRKAKRVVVKVGTALLTGGKTRVDRKYLVSLVNVLAKIANDGCEVALVTSGSIGIGCGLLGFETPPKSLPDRQACAAAGQVDLMKLYRQAFGRQKPPRAVGQLLLTRDGLEDRKRYLNAVNTLDALFRRKAIPIINENDTVSIDELRFGDNDKLSALVALAAEADSLIILSDVPGFMSAPPRENKDAKLFSTIEEITPEIEVLASPKGSILGTGGMVSKLEAAKVVTSAGEAMVLVGGHDPEVLLDVLDGREVGTYFVPKEGRLKARKRWLAFNPRVEGQLVVDKGAKKALVVGKKSLLPSGIITVKGKFEAGAMVEVLCPDEEKFARGLINYSSFEVEEIMGKKTSEVTDQFGELMFQVVIGRDNLVILENVNQ